MGENADVLRQELEAFNARDSQRIVASFSHDCPKDVPGAHLRGGDQIAAWCSALWEAFPDIRVTVASIVEAERTVAIEGRVSGTHEGTLRTPNGDIPPTGRWAEVALSECAEVEGGVIVAARLYFDRLELLEQLGVTPIPASA